MKFSGYLTKSSLLLFTLGMLTVPYSVSAEDAAREEVPGLGLSYVYTDDMETDGFHVYTSNYNNLRHLGILNARTKDADLFYILIYPEEYYLTEKEEDHWASRFEAKFPGTVSSEETYGDFHYTFLDMSGYEREKTEDEADFNKYIEYCDNLRNTIEMQDLVMAPLTFDTVNLDGEQVTNAICKEKKITILNVWATYCNPCINEMPELAEMEKEYEEDTQILYLCSDVFSEDSENIPLANRIVEKAGINRKNVLYNLPGTCEDIIDFVSGVPTTFFMDENGVLLEDFVVGASVPQYKEVLEKYLK